MQDPSFRFFTLGDALAGMARRRGDAVALRFPESGRSLTFDDWHAGSLRLAGGLMSLGLRPGDHLALLAENRIEWPVVQGAAALTGAVLVPLNTHHRREDLGFVLKQSRARAMVLSPRFRSNDFLAHLQALRSSLPQLELVVLLDEAAPECLAYADLLELAPPERLPEVDPGDVGSLQYTSGTTGFPKGALLTHEAMLKNAFGAARRLGIEPADKWTSIIPLFHCAGCILNLLGCLQTGACYVGVSHFDPELMFQIIESERCTVLSGVPTSYLAMLEHPARERYDLSSLRTGTCGGADTDAEVLSRCAERFPIPHVVQVYGQTESSTLVACPRFDDPKRFENAGEPLEGYAVRITDVASGEVLKSGETGQIEARGAMVMRGYFENETATAETIGEDGWLKTGDLGYLDPEGRLVIAGGRLRDLIIRGGENIYPVEIENHLRTHPSVLEIAVFGMKDRYYGETVAAAVKLRKPVDAFPMTSSGKVRKAALKKMAEEERLGTLS
ncbi:MAG TPA: AMP-binding protein [Gammaproteobacteria bacterium]|nr:AMP-binding protein [Gammaproteobacteria bacterium]